MSMAIQEAKSDAKSLIPRIRALFSFREAGILLVLLALCAILSLIAPRFLTVKNLQNVARQFSVIAIMSVGMTYVIITAGIDLSVGSVIALSGCMTAWYLVDGYPIWLSVLIGLSLGALTGLVNGLLIVKINLAPFIATLGTMGIARGVVLALTMGYPIQPFPEEFQFFGRGSLGPIPIPVVIMTIIIILGHIFLTRTTTGRYIYYVGSNPTAARLSGLKVGRILILVYTLAGLLAGVSAVVLISRLTSAQSNMGMGWELDAIAAVVIGGTSLAGGEGSVLGSLIGAALMGVIKNALILLGVNVYWQSVVIGIVIVLAVGLDAWRQSRRRL
jgi:ribose transport system permease protein